MHTQTREVLEVSPANHTNNYHTRAICPTTFAPQTEILPGSLDVQPSLLRLAKHWYVGHSLLVWISCNLPVSGKQCHILTTTQDVQIYRSTLFLQSSVGVVASLVECRGPHTGTYTVRAYHDETKQPGMKGKGKITIYY